MLMSHHVETGHSFAVTFRPRWPFMNRTVRVCQDCSMCGPPGFQKDWSPGHTVHWRMCGSAVLYSCQCGCEEKTFFFFPLALTFSLIPNPLFSSSPISSYKDCHLLLKASVKVILITCYSLHCAALVVGKEVVERRERIDCLQSWNWRLSEALGLKPWRK